MDETCRRDDSSGRVLSLLSLSPLAGWQEKNKGVKRQRAYTSCPLNNFLEAVVH